MTEKKFNLTLFLLLIAAVIILASLLSSIVIASQTNYFLNQQVVKAKESSRPAELNVILLKDSNCQDCFDLTTALSTIEEANAKISSPKTVEISSPEGQGLIAKYSITKIPALLISGELDKNDKLQTIWSQWGEIKDGTFVLRQIGAPYLEVATSKIRGRIKLTMLTDSSCGECYDVTQHETILGQFGFQDKEAKVLSVTLSDGQVLADKYNIKLLPTIILTGDIEVYPSLVKVWPQVGTVESDGAYVFREGVKQMGTYKNLATNNIIKPQPVTPIAQTAQ